MQGPPGRDGAGGVKGDPGLAGLPVSYHYSSIEYCFIMTPVQRNCSLYILMFTT